MAEVAAVSKFVKKAPYVVGGAPKHPRAKPWWKRHGVGAAFVAALLVAAIAVLSMLVLKTCTPQPRDRQAISDGDRPRRSAEVDNPPRSDGPARRPSGGVPSGGVPTGGVPSGGVPSGGGRDARGVSALPRGDGLSEPESRNPTTDPPARSGPSEADDGPDSSR